MPQGTHGFVKFHACMELVVMSPAVAGFLRVAEEVPDVLLVKSSEGWPSRCLVANNGGGME